MTFLGMGLMSGHYLSLVQKENSWWLMDDSRVTRTDVQKVLQSDSSYILFYTDESGKP